MRRMRKDETKVWHNPEIAPFARPMSNGGQKGGAGRGAAQQQDSRALKEHRAALEALFTPRREAEESPKNGKNGARETTPKPGRIVLAPPPQRDERANERQRLLGKLLGAEGRPNITKAANEFLGAGFTFPEDQDVHLKMLEHSDEDRVRDAIDALASLLVGELPQRKAVLESRLRRIEEMAEEVATREAAARLRRQVSGRIDMTPGCA